MLQRLHVELDAILDTRLATAALINQQAAVDLMNRNYGYRLSDEMSLFTTHLTDDQFRAAYAKRDVTTLMAARPTRIFTRLGEWIGKLEAEQDQGSPRVSAIEVEINVYPYELTDEERLLIAGAVYSQLSTSVRVVCVSIPLAKLTTEYIADAQYTALFLYNYQSWFDQTIGRTTVQPRRIETVTVVAPQIGPSEASIRESMARLDEKLPTKDPFIALEKMMSLIIALNFVSPEEFSVQLD